MRVVVDDPGVALDECPVGSAADRHWSVIESDTCGFALMCSSFLLKSVDDVR